MQVVIAGAYRSPREINWWFGTAAAGAGAGNGPHRIPVALGRTGILGHPGDDQDPGDRAAAGADPGAPPAGRTHLRTSHDHTLLRASRRVVARPAGAGDGASRRPVSPPRRDSSRGRQGREPTSGPGRRFWTASPAWPCWWCWRRWQAGAVGNRASSSDPKAELPWTRRPILPGPPRRHVPNGTCSFSTSS